MIIMSDLDVASIVKELSRAKYKDKQYNTLLLQDEELEYYVIKDISIDADNDIVARIERL